jgi:hypothetical protein
MGLWLCVFPLRCGGEAGERLSVRGRCPRPTHRVVDDAFAKAARKLEAEAPAELA